LQKYLVEGLTKGAVKEWILSSSQRDSLFIC